jgi:hypothetical protein
MEIADIKRQFRSSRTGKVVMEIADLKKERGRG